MKIAIFSDIHDHVWNLQVLLNTVRDTDALICCGDLCSPFIIPQMDAGFSKEIHIVFGNNDGDLYRITQNALAANNKEGTERIRLYGQFLEREIGGQKFAVNHYPDIALPIAVSGKYDVVCYGHNHQYKTERIGKTVLINPGTVMGYDPINKKDVSASFVIYDTITAEAGLYKIIDSQGTKTVTSEKIHF